LSVTWHFVFARRHSRQARLLLRFSALSLFMLDLRRAALEVDAVELATFLVGDLEVGLEEGWYAPGS
jgi:hypothetical protein